jgi:hypothetical protein
MSKLEKLRSEISIKTLEILNEMASTKEPWGLFEPYLWKDKVGDSRWHCEIRSVNCCVCSAEDETIIGALEKVYFKMKNL